MQIYKKENGVIRTVEVDDAKVIKINSDNFLKMENTKGGINIFLKDGDIHFIENAIAYNDNSFDLLIK